ncbi:SGNH/GDSL hydrolase family protein [Arthrobacter sp. H5]|uniref:SGNH/GDSL hydrolase family protein n=1 Tax=Arthrobacter sp. H5 TaxID=1267973 RepID=UPI0009DDDD26|nr:SGNH/GDSL hydrolase family protein [Arthrobacter sp. H5]
MKTTQRRAFGRAITLTLMTVGLVAGLVAGPAAASPKEPLNYVSLGDSYAAGFGAGSYLNACGQSPLGLPTLLDAERKIQLTFNATCSGAEAAVDPDNMVPDLPDQLAGLIGAGLIGSETDLITLSAGGNDLDFGTVLSVCASQSLNTCEQLIKATEAQARTSLSTSLNVLYQGVRSGAPNSQVIVTGYPHLFSPKFGSEFPLSVKAQKLFNKGTDTLNKVIKKAAKDNGFEYVSVVKEFDGHGIGSPNPWIKFTGTFAIDDFHPNASGYRYGYFEEVFDEVEFRR